MCCRIKEEYNVQGNQLHVQEVKITLKLFFEAILLSFGLQVDEHMR